MTGGAGALGVVFESPWWLWAAALALPSALAAWACFDSMSATRRWSAIVARVALLVVIAGMLAGANAQREVDRVAVVGVVDLSESVRRFGSVAGDEMKSIGVGAWARRALGAAQDGRRPDDGLGIVAFDGRALVGALPARADVLGRELAVSGREGTSIEEGLRLAAGIVPPDAVGRVVLFTDGNQTRGDARRAAAEIAGASAGRSVRIDVVAIGYVPTDEVVVERVEAPSRAGEASTVPIRVSVRSSGGASGTVRLLREGEPIDANGSEPGTGLRVELAPGTQVITIPVRLPAGRVHRFEAVFEPDLDEDSRPIGDRVVANNRAGAFTLTPSRGRVLVVDGVSGGAPGSAGSILPDALADAGIDVEVTSSFGVPGELLALDSYDLVVLQNVPAEDVPERAQRALDAYVRDLGGGLVMVGGEQSFGAGGWKGTVVGDLLPVYLDLPDTIVTPEAAVVFVLDNSGSMGQGVATSPNSKQQIANESAAQAIETLDERDLVGVIAFNSTPRVVVPIGPNDDPDDTQAAVRSIGAGGGTFLPPALELAHEQLRGVEAKVKQVVVLSDGQSEDADRVPAIAARMQDDGIRVSTIAVGDEADERTMSQTARSGGGAFYSVRDASTLPRVFMKAVRVIRRPLIRETPFTPVFLPTASPMTQGIASAPDLGGLVLTRAREEPTITYAMATPQGEPVLAHWPVGLGQVVAFTSDAHDWADGWIGWEGYAAFWGGLVRSASRAPDPSDAEMRVESEDGVVSVSLDAYAPDGSPLDGLEIPADVYRPDGTVETITLRQTGAGIYEGSVRSDATGTVIVIAKPASDGQRLPPVLGGVSVADSPEFAALAPDEGLLRDVARLGGGRVLSAEELAELGLFERDGIEPQVALTPLWPVLAWWALAAFLLDVGTRRVAWDRLVSKRFGADLRAVAADAVRDRSAQAAGTLAGIRRGRDDRRESAPAAPSSGSLDAGDAARTARQQLKARAAAERERLRAIRDRERAGAGDATGLGASTPERSKDQADAGDAPGTEGLLAAKRRARERLEREGDPDA